MDVAARDLTTHAASFRSGMDATARTWSGLGASYVSEDSPTVLAAFAKVSPLAARVSDDAELTSQALSTFSSTCRDLQQRLESYGRSVAELDADIDAFPSSVEKTTMVKGEQITTQVQQHWSGEADLTARHDALAVDVKAIENDYVTAQSTCAAALAAVSGGEVHAVSQPARTDLRSGNWVDDWLWDAGTFLGIDHNAEDQPWGRETVPYRPNGVMGLLQGVGAGGVELVDGVWSMVFTGNQAKRDQAWGGVNALIGAAGSLAATPLSMFDQSRGEREAPEVQKALDLFGSMGPAFIHLDEADTNPNWAIGGASFNVVTTVFTAGAGGGLKAGTVASKAGLAAERLSIASMDSSRFAGLSTALGGAANGLGKTGAFLSKPGSLALKVSDIVMPNTTAKVLDSMTKARVAVFTSLDTAKSTTAENLTGARRAVATGLAATADGIRTVDDALPRTDFALANGAVAHAGGPGAADWLDNKAASIRENNPPAFVPPHGPSGGSASATKDLIRPEPFTRPDHVTNTVVLRHGNTTFPIHRKENFAARTGLRPNTEYIIEHRSLMKDDAGVLDANTVEKYYTDDTGTVTRVDTYAGIKGAWSPELNKPTPNVTYNVVAQVDGGLQNTFTLIMDHNAHLASAKGHITSTLVGDTNRNRYQQLKAGRLGGAGYDGGHAAPSALGFIGERGGLFPQHEWQNRGIGTENDQVNFHETEMKVINEVKAQLTEGQPVDLRWEMKLESGPKAGMPMSTQLTYAFGSDDAFFRVFNNLPDPK